MNSRILFAALLPLFIASTIKADQPNIVLIMADDLGYGDLACYGNPRVRTPNIDQLAKEGVRFTQHYANGPECSPTRTALLTGRYQQFAGGLECAIGTGNVGRYDDAIRLAKINELGLPAGSAVIPKAIQNQGYKCAVYGKWHLGYEPKFNPISHGWNDFFGYLGGNVHYFNHRETSDLHVLFDDDLPVYREGYMTDLITDSSVDFINRTTKPFLLFVSHESPHFPFQGPEDKEKPVDSSNWMDIDPQAYISMIESLDESVGKILRTIEEAGKKNDTVVIFVSDNGGFANAADMGVLRGSKSMTYEGGIRVPLIIRWPEKITAGQVSDQVSITFDLTRSILNLAGISENGNQSRSDSLVSKLDGYDIIDHVMKQRDELPRTLFWRGKRGNRVWRAVRHGDYKLVTKEGEADPINAVYDLSVDPAETKDITDKRPDLKRKLSELLKTWERDTQSER